MKLKGIYLDTIVRVQDVDSLAHRLRSSTLTTDEVTVKLAANRASQTKRRLNMSNGKVINLFIILF